MPPGLPQPPMLAGQSGPPSNMLTGYHHYQPQPLSGPPHYIGNTDLFGISGTVGQPPMHPSLRSYQAGPPAPSRPQNVNPDLRQHPVRMLAGEPRPVQELTGLQGWPHPLHYAVQVFGNQQSPELTVFLEQRPVIRRGILSSVQYTIAPGAYARGLISEGVHRTMTDPLNLLTADQRTDIFLNELESSIRNDASVLTAFVEVLRQSDAAYYATIIRIINQALHSARAGVSPPPPPPAEQGGQH